MPPWFRVLSSPSRLVRRTLAARAVPVPATPAETIARVLVVAAALGLGLTKTKAQNNPRDTDTLEVARSTPPPAERWLPTNTLAFVTCPDIASAGRAWSNQAPARFWADPAMKPFRDRWLDQVRADLLAPIARLTGLELTSLAALAEGQFTVAQVAEGDSRSVQVLLLDAGSRTNELNAFLASLRAARRDPATSLVTNRLRDVPFLTLRPDSTRWRQIFAEAFSTEPGDGQGTRSTPPSSTASVEVLHIGASGSLLWIGTGTQAIEQSLARFQAARSTRPFAPASQANDPDASGNRVTVLHTKVLPAGLARWFPPPPSPRATNQAPRSVRARLRETLGLSQVRGASATLRAGPTGWFLDLDLDVPPANRRGLFKLVEFRAAPADPPGFVGADAVRFTRWRLPGPTAWASFERLLLDADPALLGVLQLFTGYAGRTEDPDFDFQTRLIDRLGDDWVLVSYPLPPGGGGATADLLIAGTPHANELLEALTLVTAPDYLATFLPPDSPPPVQKRRQVNGRDLVSLTMPPMPWLDEATGAVHFASRDGWVAAGTRVALLERFLAESPTNSLAARPDFQRAAGAVGGGQGGFLSYRDDRAWARALFAELTTRAARQELPVGLRWLTFSDTTAPLAAALARWLDFGRLPPFESVSRHFSLGVRSGHVTTNGFHLRVFRPVPSPP